jgi:hypothetical protein
MNPRYRARLTATASVVLAGLFSLALVQSASATQITPPPTSGLTPDHFTVGTTGSPNIGTLVTSEGSPASFNSANDFSLTEYVYRATSVGAATGAGLCVGCLNFVLTAEVDAPADITSFTLSNFSPGDTMDAGYNTGLGTGVDPTSVGDSSIGSVTFTYSPALGNGTQEATAFMEVETSATTYGPGTMCGGSACAPGYEPTPAPLIGHGPLVLLAVGGVVFGGKLWETLKKRRSLGTAIPHAA